MTEQSKPAEIVYKLPGMEQATVHKNIIYKTINDEELKMDVYYPSAFQYHSPLPTVIFVHGDAPPEHLRTTKDSGQYVGWGQLTAASGLIAVTFHHRSSEELTRIHDVASDIEDLIQFVRDNAHDLQIDANNLGIWVCSAGGPYGLRAAMREKLAYIKCIISYYGFMSLEPMMDADAPLSKKDLAEFSAVHHLKKLPKDIAPLFIARAGLDYPELNGTVDRFIAEALAQNISLILMNHPEGHHGFDMRDDNARSHEIIQATLNFMRDHLIGQ